MCKLRWTIWTCGALLSSPRTSLFPSTHLNDEQYGLGCGIADSPHAIQHSQVQVLQRWPAIVGALPHQPVAVRLLKQARYYFRRE